MDGIGGNGFGFGESLGGPDPAGGTQESNRGPLLIAGCRSGVYLSRMVSQRCRALLNRTERLVELEAVDKNFSDTETCVRLDRHVAGSDAFLFQAAYDPACGRSVDQNLMAYLIAARTLREHGAHHVTGVLPYLPYSRQDKATEFRREPVTARLIADLSLATGIDRLVTWASHGAHIRGFYGATPVNMLESLSLFIQEFDGFRDRPDVIAVAPDAGASRFVTRFARALHINCAIASKHRPEPETVRILDIIGDFSGKRTAIVLDDMISGGGTVRALAEELVHKGICEIYLGVSHNLCVGNACALLSDLHSNYSLKKVIVTNSIPQTPEFTALPFVSVRCLSDTLATVITHIHREQSVSEVFYQPE
ncbi:MAG: ribose-phosphate pyrophosphokinase [Phycisphaerae bacterium]|nr:ribose-phosphate pyrophosphokinase [Phycisphaerae bacterium]